MIKIELNDVKNLLDFHYKNINTKKGKEWTLINYLDNRISLTNNSKVISMYNFLKKKTVMDSYGFSILTATPKKLEDFAKDFENRYSKVLDSRYTTKASGKIVTIRMDLLNVFYYEAYDKWKAYELAKKINVNVCPYCNRSYTFVLGNDLNKGTRFEYDHFLDKATFPYLALSFYNLVPSCHICNSNLKGSDKFEIDKNIHPYIEGFENNIVFSIKPKNVHFINGKPSAYTLEFIRGKYCKWDMNKINAAQLNISVFRLDELYNMHKDYINEIIQKSIAYNDDHIRDLYKKYNGTLFSSEDDIKRMVLGNYINVEDYSKRPLSKLTADISRELGFIK